MKVYLALSLAFVCLVCGDDVHHLRGDAQKSTATEMPLPANDEVGAVAKEPSQKQEVAETPTGTENEASQTPAEEVGAVAKEPETSGNDKLPTQENAKGTENEAQMENGKEAGVVAKEPSPKGTAAKPQDTPPRTGVHVDEPDAEVVYPLYYPEEEEWGYDGPDEDIPEWDERAQWDLDDYDYPEPEAFEEPVGVVVKESDPSDPSDPSDTEAAAASAATAGAAVAAGKEASLLRRWGGRGGRWRRPGRRWGRRWGRRPGRWGRPGRPWRRPYYRPYYRPGGVEDDKVKGAAPSLIIFLKDPSCFFECDDSSTAVLANELACLGGKLPHSTPNFTIDGGLVGIEFMESCMYPASR